MPRFRWVGSFPGFLVLATGLLAGPPARGASRIEREVALDAGGQVVVSAEGAAVSVVGTARSGVRFVITSKDDIEDSHDVRFEGDSGRATVTIERKASASRWFGWFGGPGLRVEIELPPSVGVSIDTSGGGVRGSNVGGNVQVSTSGGAIDLVQVGGDVEAETSGGGIWLSEIGGKVDADTSGGAIEIRGVGGDVRAESSGGGIRVYGARGRVDADTSGGPVEVEFGPGNGQGGSLSSSGGRVRATIDPAVDLEIDASSSGGRVTVDVPVRVHGEISRTRLRGTIGDGGPLLRLRSSGGGVHIEPGDTAAR